MKRTVPRAAAGLFESHVTVTDLDQSVAFYLDTLGLLLVLESRERGAAFVWIA
jgi:lactoylglutathione lyase